MGLLLWGGFDADTTAGLEIGFEAVSAATSFFPSFAGEVFALDSSFIFGGLTFFFSSSGSSKFSDRTVDDDRHRSLFWDSCSTGFAVTLALAIVDVVVVLVEDELLLDATVVFVLVAADGGADVVL